jgi:branched-chain amino acid transport system substrate-binding protein
VLTESFYRDLNDRTRVLHGRLRGRMADNHASNSVQAQAYGCAFHYLRAVTEIGAVRSKAPGLEAVQTMKRLPRNDGAHSPGSVRANGRKLHPTYPFHVKEPAESRWPRRRPRRPSGPWRQATAPSSKT